MVSNQLSVLGAETDSVLLADVVSVSHTRNYLMAKRIFDVGVASMLLLALAPVFALIALLVKLKSPGDILFSQYRCGEGGHPFVCYKFRTMVPHAMLVLEQDDTLRSSYAQHWKLVLDPRVTPIGRLLRKTSLDELPQLWNVLKGDMSIVGPRPVQIDELQLCYGLQADIVTSVRPGLTGLWQVSGRSSLTYYQRVELDVHYVRHRSLWLDMKILLKTIPALILTTGAH